MSDPSTDDTQDDPVTQEATEDPRPQDRAHAQAPSPEPDAPRQDGTEARQDRREAPRRGERIRGIARRIFRELDEEVTVDREAPDAADAPQRDGPQPRPRPETRDLLGSMLETGDKAKTEIVRLVAREVRSYLEALELHKDLHHLLTNYSLEVNASLHLRPLADREPRRRDSPNSVKMGVQPKADRKPPTDEDTED